MSLSNIVGANNAGISMVACGSGFDHSFGAK